MPTASIFSRRDAGARGAIISGYMGTLNFDWFTNELRYVRHHAPFSASEKAAAGTSHFGGDTELAENFMGVIRGSVKSRTLIADGIQSAYACLAAKESAAKGRFVKVRQVDL